MPPVGNAVTPRSTCTSMCPIEEVHFRNQNALVHPLESIRNGGVSTRLQGDPKRMVKEYTRSAAGSNHLKSHLLRTTQTLLKTIDYLLGLYANSTAESFPMIYSFVSDRLRAVRQDMILQQASVEDSRCILERMIPFYVETEYKCTVTRCKSYEWKLHSTQLEECFSRWADVYEVVGPDSGLETTGSHDTTKTLSHNEIVICYFLRQIDTPHILHTAAVWRRKGLISLPDYRLVFDIILAYKMKNYVRFFRLLKRVSRLCAYSMTESLAKLRREALMVIAAAYKSPAVKVPVSDVCSWMSYSRDSIISLFEELEIPLDGDILFPAKIPVDKLQTVDLRSPSLIALSFS